MKKNFGWILFAGIVALSSGCAVHGVVTDRPADVYYERPVAPGPDYIWISGDWVWTGGRYSWREGRWEHRREGRVWHEGQWRQHPKGGWRWQKGHW
ncbi:MAG TPA: hypothetical protein VKT28_20340 [Puia sp.]|nr:hypothetical protein [Puia sp.]